MEFKGLVVKTGGGCNWLRIMLNDIRYPCVLVNLTLCSRFYIYIPYLFTFQQQTNVVS
jgi:hypothetical protein